MTRRWSRALRAVALGGALVMCGGAQVDASDPPRETAETPAAGTLRAGPMLGHNTHREISVWAETDGPAVVAVRYWPADDPGDVRVTAPTQTESTVDNTHIVRVWPLEPGARYRGVLTVDGVDAGAELALEPLPLWRWMTSPPVPPDMRIAIGSCNYVNDPPYDRRGNPYGGGYDIYGAIAAAAPDVMLWLGDNVYLREADWGSRSGIAYRYSHDRAIAELQPLLATAHHYATWDDHDFGPNDSDRSYALQGESLDVFRSYWTNPTYGLPGHEGVFTRFVWGDVEFFLLDNRMFRAANDAPDGEDKPFLGDVQLAWLLDALTSSTATFKIVVNGNQTLNDHSRYEAYAEYETERQRLLSGVAERRVSGLVFLSGDRHHTELLVREQPGLYPLFDFTSSPLTSGAGSARGEEDNPQRVDGTLVTRQRNFGTIDVTGAWEDRTLTFTTWSADGEAIWSHTIHESELQPPEIDTPDE